mgnify:CR=1 FL=1
MGASRWFECEEQPRFIMMRHDCLYFGSGSFSKIHTQRPRGRSSMTHNCNDPSGEKLRCDTPPRHNAKANSQFVKADLEKNSAVTRQIHNLLKRISRRTPLWLPLSTTWCSQKLESAVSAGKFTACQSGSREELRWDIKRFPLKPTVMDKYCYSKVISFLMFG